MKIIFKWYYVKEKIQLELPIKEKTVSDSNSEHTLLCLVLKRPLRQMSSAKQNNRDFSGSDVMEKNHSYLLGRFYLSLSIFTFIQWRRGETNRPSY